MREGEREPRMAVVARLTPALFVTAILLGSFLLFLVQPLIARMALPRLGGAPAVWNSAMLVYQGLLLAGYAYAHLLRRFSARWQAAVHLALLAIAAGWLPIGLARFSLPAGAEPALWVPWLLVASIGPLFLAVSAQAPLLQRWFSLSTHGRDPYALYAASNIGSFAGLIAYPLLVEPLLTLGDQRLLWSAGYCLLLLLVAVCGTRLPRTGAAVALEHISPAPSGTVCIRWMLLALVPSGLMLATTTFLTTDIVAGPLVWVLPLGIYLLSFTVAFRESALIAELSAKLMPVLLLMFGATMIAGNHQLAYVNALIGLFLLFAVCVACHARLYALRPAPDRLTGFYLVMALGGMLGGVFAGLLAPLLFDWTYEYPLLILAAGALVPQLPLFAPFGAIWRSRGRRVLLLAFCMAVAVLVRAGSDPDWLGAMHTQLAFVLVALLGLLAIGWRPPYLIALAAGLYLFGGQDAIKTSLQGDRTRSYFGIYTVSDGPDARRLAHGTTLHGIQLKGARALRPTTYYQAGSGVGAALQASPMLFGAAARIGVVGLGTGTLACYARPGQHWRFFEIDPTVVRIARDSGAFTFLRHCTPNVPITLGDARLRLAESAPASFDLLVLDAFSSDAVPIHLLTREAFAGYGRVVAPKGLLLVHISNRFLALGPVVAGAAAASGWQGIRMVHAPSRKEREEEGATSDWIALSRSPETLAALDARNPHWRRLTIPADRAGWSDDYASVVRALRLFHPAEAWAD